MNLTTNLQEKIIIIAEEDNNAADEIRQFLQKSGFKNIFHAVDGSGIYEILRPYYNNPEKIGLIIVNAKLPQCQVEEMCITLSTNEDGSVIPFIIYSDQKTTPDKSIDLCHYLTQPIQYDELLTVIGFMLNLKNERHLRHQQEEQLINELAERKVIDAKLKYLVVHDELTGLLNRQNFEKQLRLILNRSNMLQYNGALLFIDIDRFSMINELEGFETGDRLLGEIVAIILKIIRKNDLFARIGSDEFCLFLENQNNSEFKLVAEKIKNAVYEYRFIASDVCYSITLSIGIAELRTMKAVYHPSELISRASQACNMAKVNGRDLIWIYNESDSFVKQRHKDIFWVPLIKKALIDRSFFLVFQPVVDLNGGKISHYEVLIRMQGDDNAVITPNEFIPVAERMGLIHSIDLWVTDKTIDFLATLPPEQSSLSFAINLSGTAFQDESLLPTIKEKLALTWVDANRITFEITETAAVENYEKTRTMITNIRSLGCKFALDDFGAGFCSFNYLKAFPVDYVKIDGQFIQNLINDETDQVLVRSMAEIANKLGKRTIAEFVENQETIELLKEMGINLGQGYFFGKPQVDLLPDYALDLSTTPKAKLSFLN